MKSERGITMVSLVVTIALMMILAGLVIRATFGGNILKVKDNIMSDYYSDETQIKNQMNSLKQDWSGIID